MKKLVIILLLISSSCLVGFDFTSWTTATGGVAGTHEGGADPWTQRETFNAAGYDLTWAEYGTPDEDDTENPLEGAQSCYFANWFNHAATNDIPAGLVDEVWVYGIFRGRATTVFDYPIKIRDSGGDAVSVRTLNTYGGAFQVYIDEAYRDVTAAVYNSNTVYHVLLHATSGTGDAKGEVWINTDGDFSGAADVSIVNETMTSMSVLILRGLDDGGWWDDIRWGSGKDDVTP